MKQVTLQFNEEEEQGLSRLCELMGVTEEGLAQVLKGLVMMSVYQLAGQSEAEMEAVREMCDTLGLTEKFQELHQRAREAEDE